MKCYFHEELNAVATCQNCGKSLCKQCASHYTPCMCDECFELQQSDVTQQKKKKNQDALIDTGTEFIVAVVKGLVCAVLLTLLFNAINTTPTPFMMSAAFFFVPFGWALITYVEQWLPAFLMSGVVFLLYLVFKLTFSMLLGIPCFLYQVIKYVAKIIGGRTR